jgi:alkylation response protein AidB-like acyl-CoA dehydrogenase
MKHEIHDADHESFRDSVRTFLDREVRPSWDKYIEAKQFPREMWLAFGRQGCSAWRSPSSTATPQPETSATTRCSPRSSARSRCRWAPATASTPTSSRPTSSS